MKGNVEIEIGGIKYIGTITLKPETKKASYPVWGVRIDRSNNDPETSVEYIGDTIDWDTNPIYNGIKPCLMADGEVYEYLNPANYSMLASEKVRQMFDTMIEFNKCYYRISQDNKYNYVEITNDEASLKDGFTDWAFSYKGKICDKFYVGAYLGHIKNGKLRSIPNVMPTGNKTIGEFRKAAQANGEGYEQMSFNKLILLQILYLIKFKSLDSRAALGKGNTESYEFNKTGCTDGEGMYYGTQDGKTSVKCHGLEDFWGNMLQWVDGFITTDKIKVTDGNFNDIGDGYETTCNLPKTIRGIITEIYGNNKLGFIPKEVDENMSAGEGKYCNWGSTWKDNSGCLPIFGGDCSSEGDAGAFLFYCNDSASYSYSNFGSRLLFSKR